MTDHAFPINADTLFADTKSVRALGKEYAAAYQGAEPYHHICIDNFLPEKMLEAVRTDLADLPEAEASFSNAREHLKSSYNPERIPEYTRNVFHAFNSRPFILFLEEMTTKMASFVPTYNRMVCFSTGSDTFHGNPELVHYPDGEPRQSIALYYYTPTGDDSRQSHTTLFQPRPDSDDVKVVQKVSTQDIVREITPPVLMRQMSALERRLWS